MATTQRQEMILHCLREQHHLSVGELCQRVYCSPATLRRELILLEKMGVVQRYHGGASLMTGGNVEYSFAFREMEHRDSKAAIARLAQPFLHHGQAVFMDSSSSVLPVIPLLEKLNHLTIVTNGIRTALYLMERECGQVYITGGRIKTGATAVIGEMAGDFVQNFKADLAILSCRGLDEGGAYEASQEQAWIKQQMIAQAKRTLLLCDRSKSGHSYFYKLCGWEKVDALLTEPGLPQKIRDAAQGQACEIFTAEESGS